MDQTYKSTWAEENVQKRMGGKRKSLKLSGGWTPSLEGQHWHCIHHEKQKKKNVSEVINV